MGEFVQFCIGFCFFAYGIFSLMQNRMNGQRNILSVFW